MTALACAVNDNAVNDKISIVLLTHSRVGELCRTLGHLLDLPERPPIIVVDNCSIDNTAERVQAAFPTVKLICTERNLGAAGRNLGVDFVQTPYVAFCDDDTWWAPGALDTAVELLDRHARLSVLNARIVVGPQQMPDPTCATMASSPLAYHDDIGPLLAGFMAGAIVMRTEAFRKAGGYWEEFFIGGEETLLAMDILDAGGHIAYAPALVVHHWPSRLRHTHQRQRLTARNAIWTCWLRLPWSLAWQRTRFLLQQLPDRRLRRHALADALSGVLKIVPKRRVLSKETCQLLRQVWQHDKP